MNSYLIGQAYKQMKFMPNRENSRLLSGLSVDSAESVVTGSMPSRYGALFNRNEFPLHRNFYKYPLSYYVCNIVDKNGIQ